MSLKRKEVQTKKKRKNKVLKEKKNLTNLWVEWKKGNITSREMLKRIPKKVKKKLATSIKKKSSKKLSTDKLIENAMENKPEMVFEQLKKIEGYEVVKEEKTEKQLQENTPKKRKLRVIKEEEPEQTTTFTTRSTSKEKEDKKEDKKDEKIKEKINEALEPLKQPPGKPSSLLDDPKLVKALIVIIVILFIISLVATL